MTDILTYTIIPFIIFGIISVCLYAFFGLIELFLKLGEGVGGAVAKNRKGKDE